MNCIKKYIKYSTIVTLLTLPLSCPSLAQRLPKLQVEQTQKQLGFSLPEIPPGLGTPQGRGGGGASRGGCSNDLDLPPMTALIPEGSIELTISEYPTVWVYIPYTSEEISHGKLSLQNPGADEFWEVTFELPDRPGIVGLEFPSQLEPLLLNETYVWNLAVNCENNNSSGEEEDSIFGFIQRVELSQLNNYPSEGVNLGQTLLDDATAYAFYGVWYDTLNALARLKLTSTEIDANHERINHNWLDLLTDPKVSLDDITESEVIEVLTITNSPLE